MLIFLYLSQNYESKTQILRQQKFPQQLKSSPQNKNRTGLNERLCLVKHKKNKTKPKNLPKKSKDISLHKQPKND